MFLDCKNLLAKIPEKRQRPLLSIMEEIQKNRPSPHERIWTNFIDMSAGDFLMDFKIRVPDVVSLHVKGFIEEHDVLPAASLFNILNGNKPFLKLNFGQTMKELKKKGLRNVPSERVRFFLGQWLLSETNNRLQLMYRVYLNSLPELGILPHREKIDALLPLEPLARALFHAMNLHTLLKGIFDGFPERETFFFQQLSNLAFPIKQVNFRFTYHCNAFCGHCYNFSGPRRKNPSLNVNKMVESIEEASLLNIPRINLTGGEPMLYPKTVLRLIREARQREIKSVTICTNGYWAKSKSKGKKLLLAMKEAGFMNGLDTNEVRGDYFEVSAGVYHQEYIPFQTLENLMDIHYEVFKSPLYIDYETHSPSEEEMDAIRSVFESKGLMEKATFHLRSVCPIGRGANLDCGYQLVQADGVGPCEIINQIVIDPDGSVRPCCGLNSGIEGLKIGNIYHDKLSVLLRNLQNNPILQFLSKNPMGKIYEYLETSPLDDGYAGQCSLCLHALGNLNDADGVEALKQKLFSSQEFYPFYFSVKSN